MQRRVANFLLPPCLYCAYPFVPMHSTYHAKGEIEKSQEFVVSMQILLILLLVS